MASQTVCRTTQCRLGAKALARQRSPTLLSCCPRLAHRGQDARRVSFASTHLYRACCRRCRRRSTRQSKERTLALLSVMVATQKKKKRIVHIGVHEERMGTRTSVFRVVQDGKSDTACRVRVCALYPIPSRIDAIGPSGKRGKGEKHVWQKKHLARASSAPVLRRAAQVHRRPRQWTQERPATLQRP